MSKTPGADTQKVKDALFVLECLQKDETEVKLKLAELAGQLGMVQNSLSKRFSILRGRYPGLKLSVAGSSNCSNETTKTSSARKSTNASTHDEDGIDNEITNVGDSLNTASVKGAQRKRKASATSSMSASKAAAKEPKVGQPPQEESEDELFEPTTPTPVSKTMTKQLMMKTAVAQDQEATKPIKNKAPDHPSMSIRTNSCDPQNLRTRSPTITAFASERSEGESNAQVKDNNQEGAGSDSGLGHSPKKVVHRYRSSKRFEWLSHD